MNTDAPIRAVANIAVDEIFPNPANPRGKNVLERDAQFEQIRSSVRKHGILVPLIVAKRRDGGFLLIDGERRWHVARSLRMLVVPAYILDEQFDDAQLQELMFHIHMNRLQWDPATQCNATENLYSDLRREYDGDDSRILSAYQRFTGMDSRTARDRLRFLSWPSQVKQEVYETHSGYAYVVEIEEKIVEPAKRNYPEYFEKVSTDEVRNFLFRKLSDGDGGSALDVRDARAVTRSRFKDTDDREKVIAIIDRLVRDQSFTFSEAKEDFLREFPDASEYPPLSPAKMLKQITNVAWELERFDPTILEVDAPYRRKVDPRDFYDALSSLRSSAERVVEQLPGELA